MHPVLVGTITAGALCGLHILVALARCIIRAHDRRRLAPTVTFDLERGRWIPVGKEPPSF